MYIEKLWCAETYAQARCFEALRKHSRQLRGRGTQSVGAFRNTTSVRHRADDDALADRLEHVDGGDLAQPGGGYGRCKWCPGVTGSRASRGAKRSIRVKPSETHLGARQTTAHAQCVNQRQISKAAQSRMSNHTRESTGRRIRSQTFPGLSSVQKRSTLHKSAPAQVLTPRILCGSDACQRLGVWFWQNFPQAFGKLPRLLFVI